MNWCCVYKSQEEGYVLVEIQLWKVLAGTEFWTCDLLTQIFFDLQPNLPYSNWPFSWLHTVGPPINVCLAAENKRKRKSWIIDGGASSSEKMVESLTAKELGGKKQPLSFPALGDTAAAILSSLFILNRLHQDTIGRSQIFTDIGGSFMATTSKNPTRFF